MADLTPYTVAERIALTLGGLGRAVAARIAGGAMAASMILLVWTRLRRVDWEIARLLALFQAGRLRVLVGVRRAAGGGGARVVAGRMPVRFGWLLGMVPYEAACFAGQLRAELAEPEMVALLEASAQARRVLGPVCRMLALERAVLRGAEAVGAKSGVAVVEAEGAPVVRRRARVAPAPVEPFRIPLPRGVLTAARRAGFGKG